MLIRLARVTVERDSFGRDELVAHSEGRQERGNDFDGLACKYKGRWFYLGRGRRRYARGLATRRLSNLART